MEESPFQLKVIRSDSQETIFNIADIRFSPLYQEFTTAICTKYFIGLGERNQKGLRFQEGNYTLFAKDVPKLLENGKPPVKFID